MKKVLVIGSINIDLTVSTERIPKSGETVTGTAFSTNYGGKGANQAVAIAKQGGAVKFIGAVGNDNYGSSCIANLEKNGIEFCGKILNNESTGVAVITVCGGDNSIILHSGANSKVNKEMLVENTALFDWADIVVMQLEIPVITVLEGALLAKKHGCITILNPAPVCKLPPELLKLTDIIIPNEHEARLLTGYSCDSEAGCRQAIARFNELGVPNVIITLGANGCAYTGNGSIVFKTAYKSKAVDTTAAGDSFIGGLCSEFNNPFILDAAVDYASKVSSVTVSRHGAADSIPSKAEILELFK